MQGLPSGVTPLTTAAEDAAMMAQLSQWLNTTSFGMLHLDVQFTGWFTVANQLPWSAEYWEQPIAMGYDLSQFGLFVVASQQYFPPSPYTGLPTACAGSAGSVGVGDISKELSDGTTFSQRGSVFASLTFRIDCFGVMVHEVRGEESVVAPTGVIPTWRSLWPLHTHRMTPQHYPNITPTSPSPPRSPAVAQVGHCLGLNHAAFERGSDGTIHGYANGNTVMGAAATDDPPHFSGPHKAKLGWIPASRVVTAASSGSWFVHDVAAIGASTLRVPIPGDHTGEAYYWVTARTIGGSSGGSRLSAELSRSYPVADPLLSVAVYSMLGSVARCDTLAYDATPETLTDTADMDTMLHLGRSWSDPTGMVHVTVGACNASGVFVDVFVGTFEANSPPVIHSVSAIADANDPLHMTLSVNATDPDGDLISVFWSHQDAARWGGSYTSIAMFDAGDTISFTYSSGYQRRARVWVSDRHGGVAESFVDFFGYVNAAPALTQLTATPVTGHSRHVTFDSDVADFDLCSFHWLFGDGGESTARAPHHQFAQYGSYTITLTVSDGEFTTALSMVTEVALPLPPSPPLPMPPSPSPPHPASPPFSFAPATYCAGVTCADAALAVGWNVVTEFGTLNRFGVGTANTKAAMDSDGWTFWPDEMVAFNGVTFYGADDCTQIFRYGAASNFEVVHELPSPGSYELAVAWGVVSTNTTQADTTYLTPASCTLVVTDDAGQRSFSVPAVMGAGSPFHVSVVEYAAGAAGAAGAASAGAAGAAGAASAATVAFAETSGMCWLSYVLVREASAQTPPPLLHCRHRRHCRGVRLFQLPNA